MDVSQSRKKVAKESQKNKLLSHQKELLESAWEALPFPAFIRGPGDKSLFANQAVGNDVKTTDFNSELIFPDEPSNLSFTD